MKYSFYHITDSHYFSKKNYDCDPWSLPQWHEQNSFRESEEILKKALELILNDEDTHTVIFTGDMTHHGDEPSHYALVELLNKFQSDGGNVFAFTDSHDYPWFDIFRIDKDGKAAPKEHMPKEQVLPLYKPFGKDKALDTFDDDTTYIAEVFPGLRYIALGYELTERGAQVSAELMEWVRRQTEKAKNVGCEVIMGAHYPLVTPQPVYNILAKANFFADGEELAAQFADMGIHLIFTGHSHIQRMQVRKSEKGSVIYNVQTASLTGCPPKMRKITIDTDKRTAEIKTVDMELPELNLGMPLLEYTRKGFLGSIETVPYNMEHDVEAFAETGGGITLPKEKILRHRKLVSKIGKIINGLTFGKVAAVTKKYHGLKKSEYLHIKDKKAVPFIFDIVASLYIGNPDVPRDSAEYKIAMALVKKAEKLIRILHIDLSNVPCGFTLSEIVEPLLYNSGIDDDNAVVQL